MEATGTSVVAGRAALVRVWTSRGSQGWLAGLIVAGLVLAATLAVAEPPVSDPAGLDAELLQQLEEAARLDREAREARQRDAELDRAAHGAERADDERSAREATAERALVEAQRQQAELVDAVSGRASAGASPVPAPEPSSVDGGDPRTARPAPGVRSLPEEIFDRSDEVVRAGTWGNPSELRVFRLVLDADGDGHPELIRFVDRRSGELIRQEEDRNYDGVLDTWTQFDAGEATSRALDGNDDGNPDAFESYRDGRMALRELDRDDDGVRDVFYRYRGEHLVEERHDADNDGVIDLVIVYEERLRVRAEEDVDRDGRMDVWTSYVNEGGLERVARVERDRRGLGFADTIEIFETTSGTSVLMRREEDLNGDGEIDVVSFYVGGRLQRRQIREADRPADPMPM